MVLAKMRAWSPRLMEASDDSPEVGWVAIAELHVDYLRWIDGAPTGYQRPLEDLRVETIANEFDPLRLGVAVINRRRDGSLWTIDANTRIAALVRLGKSVVLAAVYNGLTPEQEASLYYHLNHDRKPLNQWNKFGARGTSGDPRVHALIELAATCGFKIGTADRSLNSIAAVGALEAIYGWPDGPRLLRLVLSKIKGTWPADVVSRDGVFIHGLALFAFSWDASFLGGDAEEATVDWRRFDLLFSKIGGADVQRKARELKIEAGFAMNASTYAVAFRDLYNGRLTFRARLIGPPAHPTVRPGAGYVRFHKKPGPKRDAAS